MTEASTIRAWSARTPPAFRRSRKFVACAGERVVGFVGIDGTYVSWLYVDPARAGQGIGALIVEYRGGTLSIRDGNHRHEAMRRSGCPTGWILVWYNREADLVADA